jgi:broad specificity phosphatase PhoE
VEPGSDGAVLIVSHKATIRLATCALLGIDPRNYRRRLDLEPCALTAFDFEDASNAKLVLYNDVSHFG